MSRDKSLLKSEIQKFIDRDYVNFEAFSEDAAEFKANMKAAIDTYLNGTQVISPASVIPKDTQIDVSSCGDDFKGPLVMGIGVSSLQFHIEMSDAWEAMVLAAVLIPSGDYLGSGVNPITSIAGLLTSEKINVYNAIYSLCQQYNDGEEAAEEIADAIHNATVLAFQTTCVYTIPSFPSGSGPLEFG